MNIGESLKYWRNKKNLTQKQLAELANISEISIRKYESNERKPKIDTIARIAESLGISIGDLDKEYMYMRQDKHEAQHLVYQLEQFIKNVQNGDFSDDIKNKNTLKAKELIKQSNNLIYLIDNAISADQEKKKLIDERNATLENIEATELELYDTCCAIINEFNYLGLEKIARYAIDLLKIPEYRKDK